MLNSIRECCHDLSCCTRAQSHDLEVSKRIARSGGKEDGPSAHRLKEGGMPPISSRSDGEAAHSAFKSAAENKAVVVFTDKNADVEQINFLLSKRGVNVESVRVTDAAAVDMLNVVSRSTMPLVFIKGDCVGGLQELKELDQRGVVEEWFKEHTYDLIVIGGGSGGLAASKEAARLGKKVLCLDFVKPTQFGTAWGLGGTCVNVGCIPKKLMHQAALLGESIEDAKKYGWELPKGEIRLNWEKMKDAVQDHVKELNWGYRVQLRERNVTYVNAYARFTGSHTVTATDKKGKIQIITGDRFLISTGLRPRYPDIPGAMECCLSSDDLFSLPYNPGKTLCVGASYVSLECAGFLKGMGCDVTVMVRSILLRGFDQDMAERIRKHMLEKGIKFINSVPIKYERLKEPTNEEPGMVRVYIPSQVDGKTETIFEDFNTVLMAIGRDAKTEDIGLDLLGVQRSKALKLVGRREQSATCPYVYGIGDVLHGCPELTPVAIQAGRVLMRRLYTGNSELTEYDQVPTTVFTPLEYGSCGMAEEAAIEKYGKDNVNVYHNAFKPLEYTVPDRMENNHCYLKLICLKTSNDLVLGCHILTPNAGEVMQGFAIALKMKCTKVDFDRMIGIHPTVAENFTTLTLIKQGNEEVKASSC